MIRFTLFSVLFLSRSYLLEIEGMRHWNERMNAGAFRCNNMRAEKC